MKQLKNHDVGDHIENVDDLLRVKGIGKFVVKHVQKREEARLGLGAIEKKASTKKTKSKSIDASEETDENERAEKNNAVVAKQTKAKAPKSGPSAKTKARATALLDDLIDTQRASVVELCRRLLENRPLFIDTETTGVDRSAEIVECAVVNVDGDVLLDSLVKPVEPMSAPSAAIHGISAMELSLAPTWPRVWNDLHLIFRDVVSIGAFNAPFDRRMLRQSNERHSISASLEPHSDAWFCLMHHFSKVATSTFDSSFSFVLAKVKQ